MTVVNVVWAVIAVPTALLLAARGLASLADWMGW